MPAAQVPNSRNQYCGRLRLPTPDLDAALARPEVTVVQLMALAVFEAGGPLSLEAVADRLKRLALPPRLAAAAEPASLRKVWRGQAPLVRDPQDGRFYLDLLAHHEIRWIAYLADPLRAPSARPRPEEYRPPPDGEPLSQAEVEAAFADRTLYAYSSIRTVAAVLEASGAEQLSLEEIHQRLASIGARTHLDKDAVGHRKSDLVAITADGMLRLNPDSRDAPAFRRDIRRMAGPRLRQQAVNDEFRARLTDHDSRRAEEERRHVEEARRVRRALVHVVIVDDVARAAAVIDAGARQQRLFIGEAMSQLPGHLEGFEFLAGVDLRPALRSVGLDPDHWWLAELRPTQRTVRPSDQGVVTVNLPAVVRATTGKARVPADPAAWLSLLNAGSTTRLGAKLGEEAQALFALFEYGRLHGGVRARRRAGDRLLPVNWSMRGDADFDDIVTAANRLWLPLEIVVGPSADLSDPWPLARTVTIVERDPACSMSGRETKYGHSILLTYAPFGCRADQPCHPSLLSRGSSSITARAG